MLFMHFEPPNRNKTNKDSNYSDDDDYALISYPI